MIVIDMYLLCIKNLLLPS